MATKNDDKELVARAAQGDKEAYRLLVERYQQRAFAIAYDILKSREDAEDALQEAFVKAYISLRDFKGESSFYTWLYRIVYNMSLDFKRKFARRGGAAVEFDEALPPNNAQGAMISQSQSNENPHEFVIRKEQALRIQQVLGQISEEHRAVILLREVEGMNYDEIARVVGISKGTVMSRLHYARKKLQSALADIVPESMKTSGGATAHDAESPPSGGVKKSHEKSDRSGAMDLPGAHGDSEQDAATPVSKQQFPVR